MRVSYNMSNITVCIITTVHPPFDTRIFYKQAKSLVKAGYKVVLIAQSNEEKIIDGIKILPIPKPKNRMSRMVFASWQAYKKAKKEKADIYHFHDPELIPMALLLKATRNKVIYDIHEDVPKQILSKEWIWKPLRIFIAKLFNIAEKKAACYFDAVVTATPTIAEIFNNDYIKVSVVQNFPLLHELLIKDKNHDENNKQGKYTKLNNAVVYVGGITLIRGAKEMIESVSLLPESYGLKLLLGGKFDPPALEDELRRYRGWERTEFLGWLDRKQVAEALTEARAGLVIIHPEPRYMVSYPVKMFEYMAAGLPVIASHFPLWEEIIGGNRSGLTVDPLNPEAIAAAIMYLLDNPEEAEEMGKRGRKAVEEKYNWPVEEKKLLKIYDDIINNHE